MPELDGVTIIALASFAALVLGWLVAPTETVTHVHVASVSKKVVGEAVAA